MFEFSEIELLELDLMGIEPHQVQEQSLLLRLEEEEIVALATARLKKRAVVKNTRKVILRITPALVVLGTLLGGFTAVCYNSSENNEEKEQEGDLITVVASPDQCYAWSDQKDYDYFDKYCK